MILTSMDGVESPCPVNVSHDFTWYVNLKMYHPDFDEKVEDPSVKLSCTGNVFLYILFFQLGSFKFRVVVINLTLYQ